MEDRRRSHRGSPTPSPGARGNPSRGPARVARFLGAGIDHVDELTRFDRERIFNLGYYTWVEQQGTRLADFDRRRDPEFRDGLMESVTVWDGMIEDLNAAVT